MTRNEQQMYSDISSIAKSLEKIANALDNNVTQTTKDIPRFEGTLDALDNLCNVKEDAGNGLYEVFNRVQESIVQGKYLYAASGKVNDVNTKTRKARPIKNFKQSIDVNKKLSALAFELV